MKKHFSIGFMTLALMCATQGLAQNDGWGDAWREAAQGGNSQYGNQQSNAFSNDEVVQDLPKRRLPEQVAPKRTIESYQKTDNDLPPSRRGKKQAEAKDDGSYFKYKKRTNLVFKKGKDNGFIEGSVKGYDANGYNFIAGKGQHVEVEFLKGRFVEAVIITKDDETLMPPVDSLPYTGKYTLRLLQPRSKARENTTQSYKARVWIYN